MDEGPFRLPRTAPEQPRRRAATAPQASAATPHPTTASQVPNTPQPKQHRWVWPVITFTIGAAMAALAIWFWPHSSSPLIDTNTYQAVFSTNGQVYFGKLSPLSGDYLQLSNVYYVQPKSGEASSETARNDLELIKLGNNEVYGPRDEMVFIKDQVLYYENLDPDGKVATLIRDNEGGK